MVADDVRRAYDWFRGRTGMVGRDAQSALELARAEAWYDRNWFCDEFRDREPMLGDLQFTCEHDGYGDEPNDDGEFPDEYTCAVAVWTGDEWETLNSISGTQFGPDDWAWGEPQGYARFLRAELLSSHTPPAIRPEWLTREVCGLACQVVTERRYDLLPILADALRDAGCDLPILGELSALTDWLPGTPERIAVAAFVGDLRTYCD
jgi:hypothetical protein